MRIRDAILASVGLLLIAPSVALSGPQPISAQPRVIGEVVEEGTQNPIPGVFVTLWGNDGQRAGAGLTSGDGRFRIEVQRGSGSYVLKAERIGYGSTEVRLPDLGPEDVIEVTVVVPVHAIPLPEIRVTGIALCRQAPEEGRIVYEVWDEVRKALEVAAWAEEEGVAFRARRYERSWPLATGRVVDEWTWTVHTRDRPPFFGADPGDLVSGGFIREVPGADAFDYFAPDAHFFVSEAFIEAYCFELQSPGRDQDGLLGLRFQSRRTRGVPDIRGTMWVDAGTYEPRHIEFEYTYHLLEPAVPREIHPLFGGRVELLELPNGAWVVARWAIYMPQYHIRVLRYIDWDLVLRHLWRFLPRDVPLTAHDLPASQIERVRQMALKDVGGELAAVLTDEGVRLLLPDFAALEGLVLDAGCGGGLADATVSLDGTELRATTDHEGRFWIVEPVEGRFDLLVTHPGVSEVEARVVSGEVEMIPGEVREVVVKVKVEEGTGVPDCLIGLDMPHSP